MISVHYTVLYSDLFKLICHNFGGSNISFWGSNISHEQMFNMFHNFGEVTITCRQVQQFSAPASIHVAIVRGCAADFFAEWRLPMIGGGTLNPKPQTLNPKP